MDEGKVVTMRLVSSVAMAAILAGGCAPADQRAANPGNAIDPPAANRASPDGTFEASGEGSALVFGQGGSPVLRLFCPAAANRLVVTVPAFRADRQRGAAVARQRRDGGGAGRRPGRRCPARRGQRGRRGAGGPEGAGRGAGQRQLRRAGQRPAPDAPGRAVAPVRHRLFPWRRGGRDRRLQADRRRPTRAWSRTASCCASARCAQSAPSRSGGRGSRAAA